MVQFIASSLRSLYKKNKILFWSSSSQLSLFCFVFVTPEAAAQQQMASLVESLEERNEKLQGVVQRLKEDRTHYRRQAEETKYVWSMKYSFNSFYFHNVLCRCLQSLVEAKVVQLSFFFLFDHHRKAELIMTEQLEGQEKFGSNPTLMSISQGCLNLSGLSNESETGYIRNSA